MWNTFNRHFASSFALPPLHCGCVNPQHRSELRNLEPKSLSNAAYFVPCEDLHLL